MGCVSSTGKYDNISFNLKTPFCSLWHQEGGKPLSISLP